MTITLKTLWALFAVVALAAAISVSSFVLTGHANPSAWIFCNNSLCPNTVIATTTPSYMTPGTATTTVVFDTSRQTALGADSAYLLVQFTGSTTPVVTTNYATTTFNISLEYSKDGMDWFKDVHTLSTTTPGISITQPIVRTVTLGATLLDAMVSGGLRLATTSPVGMTFEVPTPLRYVRAVISIPFSTTGTNGAVYAEFAAKRQNP